MEKDHKKGNYHNKYILHGPKSPIVIEKDRDGTDEDPSKDPDVLECIIRLSQSIFWDIVGGLEAEFDVGAQGNHRAKQ